MPANNARSWSLGILAGTAAIGSVAAATFQLTQKSKPQSHEVLLSPRTTLIPKLSEAQIKSLGYPPDALPGSRDVKTPYGSMRVYEWGPIDGKRVLMVHGDATPSPMYGPIADQLVAKGCRVMTYDLWGRGYTDTPADVQHDSRLYMQQLLFAITSSPVPWTGSTRFSLIGFSMGGAITMEFFAQYPSLVDSVVLMGPAGLVRKLPGAYESFYFHHPHLASKSKLRSLIGALLGVEVNKLDNDNTTVNQLPEHANPEGFTPDASLQFQFDHHAGHIQSFVSGIQYGPYQNRKATWETAAGIILGAAEVVDTPMYGGKILVICGRDDTIVPAVNVKDDLETYLGKEQEGRHWVFDTVPGGHDFPWPEGENIGKMIAKFWNLDASPSISS